MQDSVIFEIDRQPIELFKLLKFSGIAASGAQAKIAIEMGEVMVNDEVTYLKRKKIFDGDKITIQGESLLIKCDQPPCQPEEKINNQTKDAHQKEAKIESPRRNNRGRRSIKF